MGVAPECIDRKKYPEILGQAITAGWRLSQNKNHVLIWNDTVGRIEWQTTGNVFVHVHKNKATAMSQMLLLAKAKTCLSNAYLNTGLIHREDIFFAFLDRLHEWSHEAVFQTPNGERLPYMVITAYEKLGFKKIVLGDDSDPTGVEIHFCADFYERMMAGMMLATSTAQEVGKAVAAFTEVMRDLSSPHTVFNPKNTGVV